MRTHIQIRVYIASTRSRNMKSSLERGDVWQVDCLSGDVVGAYLIPISRSWEPPVSSAVSNPGSTAAITLGEPLREKCGDPLYSRGRSKRCWRRLSRFAAERLVILVPGHAGEGLNTFLAGCGRLNRSCGALSCFTRGHESATIKLDSVMCLARLSCFLYLISLISTPASMQSKRIATAT